MPLNGTDPKINACLKGTKCSHLFGSQQTQLLQTSQGLCRSDSQDTVRRLPQKRPCLPATIIAATAISQAHFQRHALPPLPKRHPSPAGSRHFAAAKRALLPYKGHKPERRGVLRDQRCKCNSLLLPWYHLLRTSGGLTTEVRQTYATAWSGSCRPRRTRSCTHLPSSHNEHKPCCPPDWDQLHASPNRDPLRGSTRSVGTPPPLPRRLYGRHVPVPHTAAGQPGQLPCRCSPCRLQRLLIPPTAASRYCASAPDNSPATARPTRLASG